MSALRLQNQTAGAPAPLKRQDFISPLFRVNSIDKALTLAIRGVPAAWQPDEHPVDLAQAREVYADEIELLDTLHPRRRLFSSGILAAALIGLVIEPGSLGFWRRFNDEIWTRHEDGRIDPVGWLIAEGSRHTGYKPITLGAEYQHYLFQSALAAVHHEGECARRGIENWLTCPPIAVSVPDALLAVRERKGLRTSDDLFRTKDSLMGRVPWFRQVAITHELDFDAVRRIGKRVCGLQRYACSNRRQRRAIRVLQDLPIPPELAATGALTAAMITIGNQPENERIWRDAFFERWSHLPEEGTDVAGQLVAAIRHHNRIPHVLGGELRLLARCCMAIKTHHRLLRSSPVPRLRSLPRASHEAVAELKAACAGLTIATRPQIHQTGYVEPFRRTSTRIRKKCRKPRRRGRTGKAAERAFESVHARYGWPRPGHLIDRTADQCGYDYGIQERPDDNEWAVEVKSVVPGREILLTEAQWARAEEMQDRYWLILVQRSEDGDRFAAIRNPARVLPSKRKPLVIHQLNHTVSAKDWAGVLEGQWEEFPVSQSAKTENNDA